jgi:hypothetical protein
MANAISSFNLKHRIQKDGCDKPTPLKRISSPRLGKVGEEVWIVRLEFFLEVPHRFIFGVMAPLYFAHPDDSAAGDSLSGLKNLDWPLGVGQILSQL